LPPIAVNLVCIPILKQKQRIKATIRAEKAAAHADCSSTLHFSLTL